MFWSSQLDILLRPGEIHIGQRPGLLSGRNRRAARVYPVTPEASGEPWRSCVERLGSALAEERAAGALHLVLSDHFLRDALVPWNENLVADAERLAFARLALSEIYGNMSDGWSVTLDQQPAGQPSFACAMDRDMLQALRDITNRPRLRLRSVGSALADRINRHRAALRAREFCLASLEPGRLTLAFRNQSGWLAVRTRRVEDPLETLSGVLRQEAAAAGAADGGTLYVVADAGAELPSLASPNWKVTRLAEPDARGRAPERAFARAAAGQ
jgi:hypothetical protein